MFDRRKFLTLLSMAPLPRFFMPLASLGLLTSIASPEQQQEDNLLGIVAVTPAQRLLVAMNYSKDLPIPCRRVVLQQLDSICLRHPRLKGLASEGDIQRWTKALAARMFAVFARKVETAISPVEIEAHTRFWESTEGRRAVRLATLLQQEGAEEISKGVKEIFFELDDGHRKRSSQS